MTERQAFIDAIIAAPDDDLPRLVFADWLDEHGEPERAEFIRVQCRLDKLTCSPFCRDGCGCEVGDLRRREREIAFHLDDWFIRELAEPCNMPIGMVDVASAGDSQHRFIRTFRIWPHEYRRGFIESISCSWSDWRQHAAAIRAATPLRKVRWVGPVPPEYRTCTHYDGWPGIEFTLGRY